MINPFVIRKYIALTFAGIFPSIGFAIGLMIYNNFWLGLMIMMICMITTSITGIVLMKNPFSLMLEGKGLIVFDINSTGIIKPFIINVEPPYIKGTLNKKKINDVFNRKTVLSLAAPFKTISNAKYIREGEKKGGLKIELTEEEYNQGRFGLFHYPALIWNSQLETIVTKDFLSEQEKDAFAEHGVLYLNRKMEELTSIIRDFGRYIVEMIKPQSSSVFTKKWVWIILIVGLILLLILFATPVLQVVKGSFAKVAGDLPSMSGAIVSPR